MSWPQLGAASYHRGTSQRRSLSLWTCPGGVEFEDLVCWTLASQELDVVRGEGNGNEVEED